MTGNIHTTVYIYILRYVVEECSSIFMLMVCTMWYELCTDTRHAWVSAGLMHGSVGKAPQGTGPWKGEGRRRGGGTVRERVIYILYYMCEKSTDGRSEG